MILFAASISVFAVLIILAPFFFGKGGHLQAAASINSLDRLEAIKESILKRFLEDERAFEEKRISKMAWEQRRQYLSNRYIDAARRLDYLQNLAKEQAAAKSQGKETTHG
jgi:hypothetical protein